MLQAPWGLASRLALRFINDNRIQSLLILSGIIIGVAVMIFLTALIDSLQANLIDKTVGRAPHIVVTMEEDASASARLERDGLPVIFADLASRKNRPIIPWQELMGSLEDDPRVVFVMPAVDGAALARSGKQNQSVLVRGFELESADQIYVISPGLISGQANLSSNEVLIGSILAENLGLKTGDQIQLEFTEGRSSVFMIGGIFDLKVLSINENWVVMDRSRAASLLGLSNRASSIEVRVDDIFAAEEISQEWESRLPDYRFQSWQAKNESLLSGLRSQSSSSLTIQFFVLLALTLGIASVLAISAVQKYKQIGILKAMGLGNSVISRIFILQALFLSSLGALIGAGLGILLTQLFVTLTQEGGEALFQMTINTRAVLRVIVITIAASAMAAYIPARRAAHLSPIEVIRNN